MTHTLRIPAILIVLTVFAAHAEADTWPQFRGPRGVGVSTETNLPSNWSQDKGVLWSTDLPGRANSSPAVTKNRIDLTTQTEDNSLWILSIDRKSGGLIGKVKVGKGKLAAKGPANLYAYRHNAATPSPIADEEHIWAFFGSGLLVCVDARSGEIQWRRDMVSDYGTYDITFGMGSSPRLWGDLVYVACMTKGASYVVALDKATGEQVWKADRRLPAQDDGPDAYSTPAVLNLAGRDQLVVSGSDRRRIGRNAGRLSQGARGLSRSGQLERKVRPTNCVIFRLALWPVRVCRGATDGGP